MDFDLHGCVRVRLEGAGPREAAAVARQLGPIAARGTGEPDVTVRFVDRIETRGPVRLLGLDECGFSDDAFLVLRSKHKSRARVRIPMERIGERCEITCERGLPAVPLLVAIVNLTALTKGTLPLHAAAFEWNGAGVVVTGWSKGGKTETLLAFARRGARFRSKRISASSGSFRRCCPYSELSLPSTSVSPRSTIQPSRNAARPERMSIFTAGSV